MIRSMYIENVIISLEKVNNKKMQYMLYYFLNKYLYKYTEIQVIIYNVNRDIFCIICILVSYKINLILLPIVLSIQTAI